jgi:hypothetical protein
MTGSLGLTLVTAGVTALGACGGSDEGTSGPPVIAGVTVSPESADVFLGRTFPYTAIVRDASGKKIPDVPITWSTSDPGVATVDPDGTAHGIGFGLSRLTASAGGFSATAVAHVTYAPVGRIEVTYQDTTPVLDTMQVTVTIYSVYGDVITGPTVYFSSDTAVFTVSPTGLAVARGVGPMWLSIDVEYEHAQPILVGVADYWSISAGRNHTCGVAQNGWTLCWGGIPTAAAPWRSRAMPFLASDRVKLTTVTSGSGFSCGVAVDGRGYCWGANDVGQLGNTSGVTTAELVEVQGVASLVDVTAGAFHTCSLRSDSTAWCWGSNVGSQLGVGPPSSGANTPPPVTGELRFLNIDAGGDLTCGVAVGGSTYCWGTGWTGTDSVYGLQLDTIPTPVLASAQFHTVAVGLEHVCALDEAGDAHCWGQAGPLGTGTLDPHPLPTRVATALKFATISAGSIHTCALTMDGAAYCWGSNTACQLGNGTCTGESLTPQPVVGEIVFRTLTAGYHHTCGLSVDGRVYCWGWGDAGALGAGDGLGEGFRSYPVPTAVYGQR